MNADTKLDPPILRRVGILVCHAVLNFYGATRCIDRACKLDQHAVASRLDYSSAMLRDLGVH